jgi:hypothetical protein
METFQTAVHIYVDRKDIVMVFDTGDYWRQGYSGAYRTRQSDDLSTTKSFKHQS